MNHSRGSSAAQQMDIQSDSIFVNSGQQNIHDVMMLMHCQASPGPAIHTKVKGMKQKLWEPYTCQLQCSERGYKFSMNW